jgi:hypothetical protein
LEQAAWSAALGLMEVLMLEQMYPVPVRLDLSHLVPYGTITIENLSAVELLKQLVHSWGKYKSDRVLVEEIELAAEAVAGFIRPDTRSYVKILEHIGSIVTRLLAEQHHPDTPPEVLERLKQVQAAAFPKVEEPR